MKTVVAKGRRGIDCSFAVPPPERLRELGFDFVIRYLSVPPSSPAKNWTRAQIESYREAEIDVGAVWEMSASRPNLGATYGEIDGRDARLEARKLDWPDDIELITACDLNSFADNIDRHEMYVRGFHKTNEQEFIGLYGDTDILARTVGVWNIGWVPVGAWAWSGTSKADAIARAKAVGAHVLQSKGYYIDDVWAVDPNDVINEFPLWGSTTATPFPPPHPPQEIDIMKLVQVPGDAAVILLAGLDATWVQGDSSGLVAAFGPVVPVNRATLKAFYLDGPEPSYPGPGPTTLADFKGRRPAVVATVPPIVVPPITVPPLTGHLSADVDTGTWHITGSIG